MKTPATSSLAIQAAWRAYRVRKQSLLSTLQFHKSTLNNRFRNELAGYHLFNEESVKEATWEEINRNLVRGILQVSDAANGNHLSGKDNQFGVWGISNKTAKETGSNLKISSYRLTCVCSDKDPGKIEKIQEEITRRDGSYEFYSLLVRKETDDGDTEYKWFVIPKTCSVINPCTFEWQPKLGTRGNKKNQQVGWKSENMEISFAMSSQLWLTVPIAEISRYQICSTTIENSQKKTMSYADIFARLSLHD